MKLVRPIEGGNKFAIWCPACQCAHVFVVPPWKLIGTPECPTVVGFEQGTAGSLKVSGYLNESMPDGICHVIIHEGKLHYQNDCTHKLIGQIIPMEAF